MFSGGLLTGNVLSLDRVCCGSLDMRLSEEHSVLTLQHPVLLTPAKWMGGRRSLIPNPSACRVGFGWSEQLYTADRRKDTRVFRVLVSHPILCKHLV